MSAPHPLAPAYFNRFVASSIALVACGRATDWPGGIHTRWRSPTFHGVLLFSESEKTVRLMGRFQKTASISHLRNGTRGGGVEVFQSPQCRRAVRENRWKGKHLGVER